MIIKNDHDSNEQGGVIYNDKEILFFGDITVQSASGFSAALAEADKKPGVITVTICSNGGWVEGGLAMYDAIKTTKNQVITVGTGAVYSSAILPFEAGDHRMLHSSARLFFHDMSISMGNVTAKSARAAIRETNSLYALYCSLVSSRTGLTKAEVGGFCQDETYFNADKALIYGLIDDIVLPREKSTPENKRKSKK